MRPLARDESAVFLLYLPTVYLFLSRLFALTKQLRPSLYLPVATTTSNRVRTKILELIGVEPQISSKYKLQKSSELFAYIKKNAYLCTRFGEIRRLHLRAYLKIRGCKGVRLGY